MKIIHKKDPFYHIIINESFSESILSSIYNEINLLKKDFKDPEFTSSAVGNEGNLMKKNKGIFLENSNKIISYRENIIREVENSDWKNFTFQRIYSSLKWFGDLLNYYDNKDYYLPHWDGGIFTLITFLYENFDECEGGELYFPEYNYVHKCQNNQSIIFLSKEMHGVSELKINGDSCRYSIVTFSLPKEDYYPTVKFKYS